MGTFMLLTVQELADGSKVGIDPKLISNGQSSLAFRFN